MPAKKRVTTPHRWKWYDNTTDDCAICDRPKIDSIHDGFTEERTNPEKVNARYLLKGQVYKELGCTEELTLEFIKQTMCNIQLFDKKQRDCGSGNIARFGEQGVLVRSSDKFERLMMLSDIIKDSSAYDWNTSTNESIEDTWQDISNYATIALLVRKGVWPKY